MFWVGEDSESVVEIVYEQNLIVSILIICQYCLSIVVALLFYDACAVHIKTKMHTLYNYTI